MTIPTERFRSIRYARDFLRELLDPRATPKVPKFIRTLAYNCLRHFPTDYEMEQIAKCPRCRKHFEDDAVHDAS